MAKTIEDLWGEADELDKAGKKAAEAKATAAKLPYTLKDEFRKAQDPALDQAINKAQSDTFGAAIKGLNMYQDISNPFARRDLAEQYQGGVSMGWKNLTDERTRRQGVYADYIEKWTGLFGAEAAKEQDLFQNKLAKFDRESNLANTAESMRRWEIENKRAEESHAKSMASGGGGSAGTNKLESRKEELAAMVRKGVYTREEMNDILTSEVNRGLYKGVSTYDTKQTYDTLPNNFEDRPGGWRNEANNTKPKTAAEQNAEMDQQQRDYYTYLVNNGFDDEAEAYREKFPGADK